MILFIIKQCRVSEKLCSASDCADEETREHSVEISALSLFEQQAWTGFLHSLLPTGEHGHSSWSFGLLSLMPPATHERGGHGTIFPLPTHPSRYQLELWMEGAGA